MYNRRIILIGFLLLNAVAWAADNDREMVHLKNRIQIYVDSVKKQSDWLVSRLQMYWSTHASDVYIKGETYDHPGGSRAPVATVKFDGTRSHGTDYNRPKLQDVIPYDDDADGNDLGLQPTEKLSFAGGHLYAYSYIWNKQSATTNQDVKTTFTTTCPDGRKIDMMMWMRGYGNREVFRALSPVNLEYERLPKFMPYKVDEQPVLTFIARQQGEAWTRPFVAVFEPSDTDEPSEIASVEFFTPTGKDAVGIKVVLKNGRTDYIFSAPVKTKMKYIGMKVNAAYAVISEGSVLLEVDE